MLEYLSLTDLTHTFSSEMPQWPSKQIFEHNIHMTYHQGGVFLTDVCSTTGVGTHVDAPVHFFEGKRSIEQLSLQELFCPAVIINIEQQVEQNPDYILSYQDIKRWIKTNGPIPKHALVVANTGWYKRWDNPKRYINFGEDGKMHFPGFSPEAAEQLLDHHVAGIAIDTLSLDAGISEDFPVHKIMLGADKFQIENIANLGELPPRGGYILTCPIPIKGAPEAFARVVYINHSYEDTNKA